MSQIVYGNIELNDKVYPFLLDGQYVYIVQQAFQNFGEFIEKDYPSIRGVTSDNRDILFINCHLISTIFDAKTIFSIQGYVVSIGNTGEPCDFSFDRMTFYSEAINTFYPPQNAIDRQLTDVGFLSEEWNGAMSIVLKPFEETKIAFNFGEETICELNIARYINIKDGTEKIGDLITSFSYRFSHKRMPDDICKYYLHLYDFLSFVNYNRNISFEKIFLETKDTAGKFSPIAKVVIFTNASMYEGNTKQTIIAEDFPKQKLGLIFEKVTSLRNNDKRLPLYYPSNFGERNAIDPSKWLSLALCFEGLFTEINPDFKQKENNSFKNVKSIIKDTVQSIDKTELTKNEKKYFSDFEKHIDRYEGVLEEKFNFVLRNNKKILKITSNKNYGGIYAEYRNNLAHGKIKPLGDNEIEVYKLLRAMIYILLLNDVNLNERELSKIISKLFI